MDINFTVEGKKFNIIFFKSMGVIIILDDHYLFRYFYLETNEISISNVAPVAQPCGCRTGAVLIYRRQKENIKFVGILGRCQPRFQLFKSIQIRTCNVDFFFRLRKFLGKLVGFLGNQGTLQVNFYIEHNPYVNHPYIGRASWASWQQLKKYTNSPCLQNSEIINLQRSYKSEVYNLTYLSADPTPVTAYVGKIGMSLITRFKEQINPKNPYSNFNQNCRKHVTSNIRCPDTGNSSFIKARL